MGGAISAHGCRPAVPAKPRVRHPIARQCGQMRANTAQPRAPGDGEARAGQPDPLPLALPMAAPLSRSPVKQGVARICVFRAEPCLPATSLPLRLMEPEIDPLRAINGRQTMADTGTSPRSASGSVLGGWISRHDLALELGLSVDTLRRWEARRFGPPCVRAGRKVYYRRDAVQDWLQQQEVPSPRRAGARR